MSVTRAGKGESHRRRTSGRNGDTGSPEVQVALLTARINGLNDHFKANVKDHHSRRGLLRMVSRRRKLLDYLKSRNADSYRTLIEQARPAQVGAPEPRNACIDAIGRVGNARCAASANGVRGVRRRIRIPAMAAPSCAAILHSRIEDNVNPIKKSITLRPPHADARNRRNRPPGRRRRDGAASTTPWCSSPRSPRTTAKAGQDFFPLTVDYQEKTFAAGKIPGGFFKREGRPSEKETLTCASSTARSGRSSRMASTTKCRSIATVLSVDPEIDPDIPAMIGASAALMLSGVPFNGPIGAARVGYIDGQYVLNPTKTELTTSALNLVVAGTEAAVLMVESEANELPEEVMLGAVVFGHQQQQAAIKPSTSSSRKPASRCGTGSRPPRTRRWSRR